LIAPDVINTMPDATLRAFADHGNVARVLSVDGRVAEETLNRAADADIDLDATVDGTGDRLSRAYVPALRPKIPPQPAWVRAARTHRSSARPVAANCSTSVVIAATTSEGGLPSRVKAARRAAPRPLPTTSPTTSAVAS
jgi:hypothetical protein